jgi:hypothetical protein
MATRYTPVVETLLKVPIESGYPDMSITAEKF